MLSTIVCFLFSFFLLCSLSLIHRSFFCSTLGELLTFICLTPFSSLLVGVPKHFCLLDYIYNLPFLRLLFPSMSNFLYICNHKASRPSQGRSFFLFFIFIFKCTRLSFVLVSASDASLFQPSFRFFWCCQLSSRQALWLLTFWLLNRHLGWCLGEFNNALSIIPFSFFMDTPLSLSLSLPLNRCSKCLIFPFGYGALSL